MRGSFIHAGLNFSNGFLLPVNQVQILLHLSALVSVLERLFGLMFHFAERVAGVPDNVRDGFHHFFHNAFPLVTVTELCSGSSLPCLLASIANCFTRSVYET
jgi:hypothetical protein